MSDQNQPVLDETFPFTGEIERDVLPALLHDRHMWVTFSHAIENHYFNSISRQHLFAVLNGFFKKYKSLPSEAQLKDMLTRHMNPSKDLMGEVDYLYRRPSFEKKEIDYLRDEMGKFIKVNKIKTSLLNGVDILDSKNPDYFQIERQMKEAVNWNPDINLGVEIGDVARRFAAMDELQGAAYPSPWNVLNSHIGGGFYPKELFIFLASSSVGKSIALDNCAMYAWECGYNVVSITLELSEARKLQRMDAAALGMGTAQLYGAKDEIGKFYADRKRGNRMYIKEFPTGSISTDHIEQYLYQLSVYEGLNKIDFLIIDYLDIMLPNAKKTGNTYIDQGVVGENLRALAQTYNTRCLTASQFSRSTALNQVPIEDVNEGLIADSWKKICTADSIMALVNTPEERKRGVINCKMIKSRNGEKDVIFPLKVNYKHLKIEDLVHNTTIESHKLKPLSAQTQHRIPQIAAPTPANATQPNTTDAEFVVSKDAPEPQRPKTVAERAREVWERDNFTPPE